MAATTGNLAQAARCTPQIELPEIVDGFSSLVSPPDVCIRIGELMRSPRASAKDFAEVISFDPSLTARLLKVVNSPFYGFTRRVDTVSRAVAIVGMRVLNDLVLAVSAVRSFSKISNRLVSMETFWRHGVACALTAKGLAEHCSVLHPERLFVAGLLHDIGTLVLFHRLPELMQELLLVADGSEDVLHRAERDTLGFTHADVAGQLLRLWGVPEALQAAVARHHEGKIDPAESLEVLIVRGADALANRCGIGALFENPPAEVTAQPELWAALQVGDDESTLEDIVANAVLQFTDTVAMFVA